MISIIFLLAFAVYSNTLVNDFVFDDYDQVLQNPWIRDVRHLPELFSSGVWKFQTLLVGGDYYRPFMHVIYMLTYYAFGLNPWGFHLVNILFNAGNAVLVFVIATRLLKDTSGVPVQGSDSGGNRGKLPFSSIPFPPFIAALLFAVHPIHTEAVAWVAALPELSYTFFCLLSFYLYVRSKADMKNYAYALSMISFALALFCKETALVLPAFLVLYDVTFPRPHKHLGAYLKRYVPYVVILGLFVALRSHVLRGSREEFGIEAGSIFTYQYILDSFHLFLTYLEKMVLPINLNALYVVGPITSLLEPKELLAVLVTMAYAVLLVIAYKKSRPAFFVLAVIVIPLLPAFYVPAINRIKFSERYLYLPSIGFVVILALALDRLRDRVSSRHGPPVMLLALLVLGLCAVGTITRNLVWRGNLSLFSDTVRKSPDSDLAHGMLGLALLDNGKVDAAIEEFKTTLKINPNAQLAYYNLGRAFGQKGALGEAITAFRKAVLFNPNDVDARRFLALAYAKSKMIDEALEEYRTFMGWEPNSPRTFTEFGNELEKAGMVEEAIAQYRRALAIDGNFPAAHYCLALASEKKGQLDQALEHLQVVVKLQPNEPYLHNLLGIIYARKGSNAQALEQFSSAVKLAPGEPSYRKNLEKALAQRTP